MFARKASRERLCLRSKNLLTLWYEKYGTHWKKYQKSLKLNIVGPIRPTTIYRWIAQEIEVCAKRYAYWSKTCFWVKIDARS